MANVLSQSKVSRQPDFQAKKEQTKTTQRTCYLSLSDNLCILGPVHHLPNTTNSPPTSQPTANHSASWHPSHFVSKELKCYRNIPERDIYHVPQILFKSTAEEWRNASRFTSMHSSPNSIKLVSGNSHRGLADLIAGHLSLPVAKVAAFQYSSKETAVAVGESVRDEDVYVIHMESFK